MRNVLDDMIRNMNRREIVNWFPGMEQGKAAYDRIRTAVDGEPLTIHQLRNALHALFRLRGHATEQETFDLFVRLSAHQSVRVRDVALALAIAVIRIHRQYPRGPLLVSEQDMEAFRQALATAVSGQVAELAREFLDL